MTPSTSTPLGVPTPRLEGVNCYNYIYYFVVTAQVNIALKVLPLFLFLFIYHLF